LSGTLHEKPRSTIRSDRSGVSAPPRRTIVALLVRLERAIHLEKLVVEAQNVLARLEHVHVVVVVEASD